MPIAFTPISSPRAFEQICSHIRAQIASGALKAGDRLPSERELAVQFGVSRNALREALRSLENAGLVVIGRGGLGGAVISDGASRLFTQSLQDMVHLGRISLLDLTEIRSILMTQAIQLACERGKEEDFALLDVNIALTETYLRGDEFEERRQAAIDFYRILAEASKNPALAVLIESVNLILRQFLGAPSRETTVNLIRFRRNMVKHLRARDLRRATDEMQRYLGSFHERLSAGLHSDRDSTATNLPREAAHRSTEDRPVAKTRKSPKTAKKAVG
jgi:GntR family transcriptional repressor for pyruvate dehydrogenase complex